jgi:hypothetical protein
MPYSPIPFSFQAGILKEVSAFAAGNRWVDGNMVRFWKGQPELFAGCKPYAPGSSQIILPDGLPSRSVIAWRALDGSDLLAFGTANHLYLIYQNQVYDITPVGLPSGQVDASIGSGWGQLGWGMNTWGGAIPLTNSAGQPSVWSLAAYGENLLAVRRGSPLYQWTYGQGPTVPATQVMGAPTQILAICVSEQTRQVIALGATPVISVDNTTGATVVGAFDPLAVMWSDEDNYGSPFYSGSAIYPLQDSSSNSFWTADEINLAGQLDCQEGNEIIGSMSVTGGRVITTDTMTYFFQLIGGNSVFSLTPLTTNFPMIGPNAGVSFGGQCLWMGPDHFYSYNGAPAEVPCDVHKYIFANSGPGGINKAEGFKVFGSYNRAYDEIIWFYQDNSGNSTDCNCFVGLNGDGNWFLGNALSRSCWIDVNVTTTSPLAAKPNGAIYLQEQPGGLGDDGNPIPYYLQSALVSYTQSMQPTITMPPVSFAPSAARPRMALRKFVPDLQRVDLTNVGASHELTIFQTDFPGQPAVGSLAGQIGRQKGPYTYYTHAAGLSSHVGVRARGAILSFLLSGAGDFRVGNIVMHGSVGVEGRGR